jgi:hypothetical protein
MTKAQRKRRAATAALALLEWRDRMARENADRENAEREMVMRYELMVAEMRRQAEEFSWRKPKGPTPSPLQSAGFPTANGNGHAGAI